MYNRVGQIFYGFEKTRFEKQRRIGKPRTPHNQFLCQACSEGICLNRRSSATSVACKSMVPNKCNETEAVEETNDKEQEENRENKEKEVVEETSENKTMLVEKINDNKKKLLNSDEEEEFEERCSEDSGL